MSAPTRTGLPVLAETRTPRLRPVPPVRAAAAVRVTYHGEHACVCGVHHCPLAFDHEGLYRSAETTWRETAAAKKRCRACKGPDRFEVADPGELICFAVVRVPVTSTEAATR